MLTWLAKKRAKLWGNMDSCRLLLVYFFWRAIRWYLLTFNVETTVHTDIPPMCVNGYCIIVYNRKNKKQLKWSLTKKKVNNLQYKQTMGSSAWVTTKWVFSLCGHGIVFMMYYCKVTAQWGTGGSRVLQSMGSQRVGHNWATEQQQKASYRWNTRYHMSVQWKEKPTHTTICPDPI